MKFILSRLPLAGLCLIEPEVFADQRGYFMETYNQRDFFNAGLVATFVQDNQSRSSKGVLRGLHFQRRNPQGKLVRVLSGAVWDVAVDLRTGSPTFGQSHSVLLSAERRNQFYVPEGFAHGFVVVSETAEFVYKCTDYYHPEHENGIRWNDPTLGIPWPDLGVPFILSQKDANLPVFDPTAEYFDAGSAAR
jgi:dTDP-4-dehydrorhamnose 3,5-epimerase